MRLQDSNRWDGQPRLLTDEEIANPMKVIHEVFDYAHLPDLRNTLWDWLKTTISGNFNKPSLHYKDRESLLALYEKMQKLLEAAHLILIANHLQTAKQKTISEPLLQSDTVPISDPDPVPATELVPIIEKIVSLLSPDLIFEIGKVQELQSALPVYHFLLVLPSSFSLSYASCQALVENACPNTGSIRLLTVKRNDLERYMEEGHLLHAYLCREERLVFANGHQTIPSLNREVLPEQISKAKEELTAASYKAESFYQGALFFLQQQNPSLAVFHFQQAIEHSLRVFLSAVTGRNHVTHDLVCLRRQALPFFNQLENTLPAETDPILCLLHRVSKAYTQTRYESDFAMPVTEISRLKGWVESLLPQTRQAFEQQVAFLNSYYHIA